MNDYSERERYFNMLNTVAEPIGAFRGQGRSLLGGGRRSDDTAVDNRQDRRAATGTAPSAPGVSHKDT
jgi:hypothetical protein